MREAYTNERLYRTIAILTNGYENLHERLPRAFDEGFGTITAPEIAEVSEELAVEFKEIRALLSTRTAPGMSSAALSCKDMEPVELEKLAAKLDDFCWRFEKILENREARK